MSAFSLFSTLTTRIFFGLDFIELFQDLNWLWNKKMKMNNSYRQVRMRKMNFNDNSKITRRKKNQIRLSDKEGQVMLRLSVIGFPFHCA